MVIGGNGRLGRALVSCLARGGIRFAAPPSSETDLRRAATIAGALDAMRPAWVVNAAAFTDVARCEDPALRVAVFEINAEGPAVLARACAVRGIGLVHVSTDYVFDGTKEAPYSEDDLPRPLQVYGVSKLEGERGVLDALPGALVVRVSTLFGPPAPPRPAYVDHILRQARDGGVMEVVERPVSSPTYAPDAAEAILALRGSRATGVVHVVNAGSCSRLELARAVVEAAGLAGRCSVAARAEPAGGLRRPAYSVLDDTRLRGLLGGPLRSWREAVQAYVAAPGSVGG